MRLLASLGLLALALINLFGFVVVAHEGDWTGLGWLLFMAALLVFFAHTLWRGWKRERGLGGAPLAAGWAGESVSAFFTSVVSKTIEGRIFLVGALVSELMAVLSFIWPDLIRIQPARGQVTGTLLLLWPVVAFTLYVKVCGPSFGTSVFSTLMTLGVALLPFYLAYA